MQENTSWVCAPIRKRILIELQKIYVIRTQNSHDAMSRDHTPTAFTCTARSLEDSHTSGQQCFQRTDLVDTVYGSEIALENLMNMPEYMITTFSSGHDSILVLLFNHGQVTYLNLAPLAAGPNVGCILTSADDGG